MSTECTGASDCCDQRALCQQIGVDPQSPTRCCVPVGDLCDDEFECCGDTDCDLRSKTCTVFTTNSPSTEPTVHPTSKPTIFPSPSPITDTLCSREDLDITFLVDNTCGISSDECISRQNGISELIAALKHSTNPRVGYFTFDDLTMQEVVSLDDVYLNNLDIPNQIVIPDYVHTVRRLDCGDDTVHFNRNQSGLNMAM